MNLQKLYAKGLVLEEAPLKGWAVYSGCEGEDANFRAFFVNLEDAQVFIKTHDPNEPDPEPLVFDPAIVAAVVTEHGVVASNDYEINDPDAVEKVLENL